MNTDYNINVESNVVTYRFNTPYSAIITCGQIVYNMNFHDTIKFDDNFRTTLLNLRLTWASIFAIESKIVNHNRIVSTTLPTCTIDNTTGNIIS